MSSIVVGTACSMRIAGLPTSTAHTADGGGSSSGDIFATRQSSSHATTDRIAKPSGRPTMRPNRHAVSPMIGRARERLGAS
jgi:hypothetical protein